MQTWSSATARGASAWLALLCACAVPLERSVESTRWTEVEADTFRVVGDIEPPKLLELAERLLVFDRFARKITNARDLTPRVPTLVLALSGDAYGQLHLPRVSAGMFLRNSRGNFAILDTRSSSGLKPEAILYHEYGHFFLRNGTSFSYPPWYDEGTAEVLRSTRIERDEVFVGDMLLDRLAVLKAYGFMPSQTLFAVRSPLELPERQVQVFYAQAWFTVFYLTYAGPLANAAGLPDRSAQTLRYLMLCDQGMPVAEAFAQAFAIDFSELDRELKTFLREGFEAPKHIARASLGEIAEPALRSLQPAEAAEALASAALSYAPSQALAERLFARSVELDPQRPSALFGLARSRIVQGESAGVAELFERARAMSPAELGQLDYAEYLLWQGSRPETAQASAVELGQQAVVLLEAIVARDPELAEAQYQLGLAYLLAGEPPARAQAAFVSAYVLLPSDPEIAYALAKSLGEAGLLEEARRVVARALASTHDDDRLAHFESLLASWGPVQTPSAASDPAAP